MKTRLLRSQKLTFCNNTDDFSIWFENYLIERLKHLSLSINNTGEWCSQRCKTKEKNPLKWHIQEILAGRRAIQNHEIYSLGWKPFIVNITGYSIIFQKYLSITCEELFKGWNGWMAAESTPPLLQHNSQNLGTSLWTWELISLLGWSRGNINITCSLLRAG